MMPGCSSLAEVRASRWNRSTNSLSKASENGRDRKSTRLNSSHDQISYAVFCLKKKNKIRRRLLYCKVLTRHGQVAQLVERAPEKSSLGGFSPGLATTFRYSVILYENW